LANPPSQRHRCGTAVRVRPHGTDRDRFAGGGDHRRPGRRFRNTRYRVDSLGLLIHRGRIFHSELGVARSRIQHTDVTQGPIQRAYGIATLTIHTAGTEDAQIELSAIAFDEARRLRAELTGQSSDDVV